MDNVSIKAAKAIIELSSVFKDLDNLMDFPVVLQTVLKKYLHIDWLAMIQGNKNQVSQITTNKSLPFNWGELYQEIAPHDNFLKTTLNAKPGSVILADEVMDHKNEKNRYCMEYTKKHTDTSQFIALPAIINSESHMIFGIYRTEDRYKFSMEDKFFLEQICPVIIAASNILIFHKQYEFQRVGLEHLMKTKKKPYLAFDQHLFPVDIPEQTIEFFREIFSDKNINGIPRPIIDWINSDLTKIISNPIVHEPISMKLKLLTGTLIGYTYIIKKYFFMSFIFQEDDCVNEKTLPLTPMENKVIDLLKQGLIVKEIAHRLSISDRGVNFHKYNIVKKLRVSNIAQAINLLSEYGL